MIFKRLKKWWMSLKYYVIADPNDNSITLSKALFNHLKSNASDRAIAQVFMFRIMDSREFGFMENPEISETTQMCDIQYNSKYRCIGFETLCPSVGQIFYDYDLDPFNPCKISVSVQKTEQGKTFYKLDAPHEKHIRKLTKA